MGFLVQGVQRGPDGRIASFPCYYLDLDDPQAALAEAVRRGTCEAKLTPLAARPPQCDPATGELRWTRADRFRAWLAGPKPFLKLAGILLGLAAATAAFLFVAVRYLGIDTRAPFEKRRAEQQLHDLRRGP